MINPKFALGAGLVNPRFHLLRNFNNEFLSLAAGVDHEHARIKALKQFDLDIEAELLSRKPVIDTPGLLQSEFVATVSTETLRGCGLEVVLNEDASQH